MIPKIIHCCWFSGEPKPRLVRKCLASWRKHAPDWRIDEMDGAALADWRAAKGLPPFVEAALRARKWAFASDWARFARVAAEGGVYLDLDVELVRPLDDLVAQGPFFACSSDDPPWVDPGLGFAAEKGDALCAEIAARYETLDFDGACHLSQTCPEIANAVIRRDPSRRLLPAAMFNPKGGCSGKVRVTSETYAIHHFAASWFDWKQNLAYKILPRLGIDVTPFVKWVRGRK